MSPMQLDILVNLRNRPDFLSTGKTIEPIKYTWVQHLERMGLANVKLVNNFTEMKPEYEVELTEKGKAAFTLASS